MKKIFVAFFLILLTGCSNKVTNIKKVTKVEEKEVVSEARVIMVGDALIHSSVYKDAYNKNTKTYDFKKQLSKIKPIVSKYDIAYYNQETPLGGTSIGLSDYPNFNTPQEFGDAMIDAGFNMISLATNHTMDRKELAVKNMVSYFKDKLDILTAGSYESFEDRDNLRIFEKNGITYSMLSYTYGTNGMKVPEGKEYLVNVWPVNNKEAYEAYKEQVKKDVLNVRDKVDVLFVAMHWGDEYKFTPNSYQEDAALYLASLGVDVVIGSHPHVVEPITWIDNTLVIYSLGNFISAQENNMNYAKMVGLMPSFTIRKTTKGNNKKIEIKDLKAELLFTYYNNYRNFIVVPFSEMSSTYLKNYEKVYETYKDYVTKLENIEFVPLKG